MTTIAFLGTGLLGSAFAEAAARRGDTVQVWNRSPEKARLLEQFGIQAFASPAEAVAKAARVHVVLKDDASVEDVLEAALPALSPEALIVDHTTTLPTLTAGRAKRLHEAGRKYLHCPVFMGPAAARNAQGIMMAAGPEVLFESAKDALAQMTGRLEYFGERPDLAAINKLFGNALIIGLSGVVADVLTLAQASDVPALDAVKLLGMLDVKAMLAGRGANMAKGEFAPSFELAMARKDVGLMLTTVGSRPTAVLPALAARMDQLIAAGYGNSDTAVIGIDAVQRS